MVPFSVLARLRATLSARPANQPHRLILLLLRVPTSRRPPRVHLFRHAPSSLPGFGASKKPRAVQPTTPAHSHHRARDGLSAPSTSPTSPPDTEPSAASSPRSTTRAGSSCTPTAMTDGAGPAPGSCGRDLWPTAASGECPSSVGTGASGRWATSRTPARGAGRSPSPQSSRRAPGALDTRSPHPGRPSGG